MNDRRGRPLLHLALFVLTAASVMATWVVWSAHSTGSFADLDRAFFGEAATFAGGLLLFLTVHEFGHFFAGKYHRIATTLPYYIPLPMLGVGTLGAVIRIKDQIPTLRKLFDIGAAGPIAGFLVAVPMLVIALATLPGPEYALTYEGHDQLKEYVERYGRFPDAPIPDPEAPPGSTLMVGHTILYWGLSQLFPDVPPMYEMYHYPLLFASWLGLFFTALNLLPVGQLDGGHILYALVGPKWAGILARGFVLLLLLSGAIGLMSIEGAQLPFGIGTLGAAKWILLSALLFVYLNRLFLGNLAAIAVALLSLVLLTAVALALGPGFTKFGYSGWLIWSALIVFLIRVDHPPVTSAEPLTPGRRLVGCFAILIFILCFSIRPLYTV